MVIKLLIFDFNVVLLRYGPDEGKNSDGTFPRELLEGLTDISQLPLYVEVGSDWISDLGTLFDISKRADLKLVSDRWLELRKRRDSLLPWVPRRIPMIAKRKRLSLLTNNSFSSVNYHMGDLLGYFYPVVTWETMFDNGLKLKPFPDGVKYILKKFQISTDEALLIGDNLTDVEAGARAGVKTALVGQAWGNGYGLKTIIQDRGLLPYVYRVLESADGISYL